MPQVDVRVLGAFRRLGPYGSIRPLDLDIASRFADQGLCEIIKPKKEQKENEAIIEKPDPRSEGL